MTHAKVLYQFPELAGKPFRPRNGTEGCTKYAIFQDDWGTQQEMLDWMDLI